ncbi:MAG: ImmA/IrrE family metallo-endopeptidase [Verrucomicrobia bacterium]|nr:ImmA/IrrE family metallo-endopeptidase [Verrucomicrobiota bacterium]
MKIMFPIHLRAARLRLGWSLDELAKHANCVTKTMLSRYELGVAMPSHDVLLKLCSALKVTKEEMLTSSDLNVEFVAFRKTQQLPVKEAERIKAEACWRLRFRWDLARILGATPASNPLPQYKADIAAIAESHASALREEWNLGAGPLPNLTNLLEDRGFEIVVLRADDQFSGISAWIDKRNPAIVVQFRQTDGARQRMDLAHELGHLVGNPSQKADEEDYAALFGGAFLFPEPAVRREFPVRRNRLTLAELKTVKAKYGISMEAILRRLRDLGILNQEGYSWWYSAGAVRKKEKMEPFVPTEAPARPIQLASRAISEGLVNVQSLSTSGDFPPDQLADLQQQAPKPKETLQQKFLRMTPEQKRDVLSKESVRLAEHYAQNPEEIIPDIIHDTDE